MAREYKDSGIEWIGQIPKDWEVCRFKNFLSLFSIPSTSETKIGLENIESETGKFIKTEGKFEGNGTHFCKGDILYGKLRPYLKKVWLSTFEGNAVGDFFVFRVKDIACSNYIKWLLLSDGYTEAVNSSVYGAKMPRVSSEFIMTLPFYLPSFSEQQKIADYLDKVCGEVDEMVALQETMIEELKAYKQSVITEAVTKGLDPNVPMRNSGIDWIGEIPEHWEAKKLKYIVDYIESGTSVNAGNVPAQANEYGVLKTSAVSKYVFDATENKTVVSEEMDKVSCPVRKNTIIVSRMNTPELVGACGYVEKNYDNIFLPDRLWQVHFVDTVYVKYIWYALRGSNIRNYYSSLSVGSSSSMQNISQSQFSNGSIPIPNDVEEQCAITSYLDTKCSEIDSLIDLKQAKIEELKEYKKSVIYEYVTGKKEIV